MLRLTEKIINEYNMLSCCNTVVAAVSGGADSVCMLGLLLEVCNKRNINLVCAHFNHQLRGIDSDNDEAFVKGLCGKLNIPFFCKGQDVGAYAKENGLSLETAARTLRYNFLNEVAFNFENSKIATAHTANDNAETVLLNLTRGSALKGLCGIPAVRENIIRPILYLSREDTENYCKTQSLGFVTDKTNFEDVYSRNKLRLKVFPLLKEINSEAIGNICKASKLLEEDSLFLENTAEKIYNESVCSKGLNITKLINLENPLVSRVIIKFIKENSSFEYDNIHIRALMDLIRKGKTGSKVQLEENLFVEISYDFLILTNGTAKTVNEEIIIDDFGEFNFADKQIILNNEFNKDKKCLIDKDKVEFPLTLRCVRQGDKFKIPNVGTKAVNRLFIDKKIPRSERGILPVLCKDDKIVWIYSIGASEEFKITNETKNYINIKTKEIVL